MGWYVVWVSGDSCPDLVKIANYFEELSVLTQFGDWIRDLKDCEGSDELWYGPIPQWFEESTNSTLT